jgi:hypothetical protein
MDHPNVTRLREFYAAFNQRDAATMAKLYAPEVSFSDPAFPGLVGPQVPGMWAQLCGAATELKVELVSVSADDEEGTAHWEAWYPFGPGKRPVHNVIHARFRFSEGRVVEHVDSFDFWRWSRQSLGVVGVLLGWSGWLRRKVQAQARKGLDRFLEQQKSS